MIVHVPTKIPATNPGRGFTTQKYRDSDFVDEQHQISPDYDPKYQLISYDILTVDRWLENRTNLRYSRKFHEVFED